MAAAENMDKMVGLFLQSALEEDTPQKLPNGLSPEAIERGIKAMEQMLASDEAIQMGMAADPSPTFVCLGMALEDKPNLGLASLRCYEVALKHLRVSRGNWERIVILQQLGAVGLRISKFNEAARWLAECAEECHVAKGHPRDAALFGGAFSTSQTRMEFCSMVEKLRAQTYHRLGDMMRAQEHLNEAKRLEGLVTGDAVQRATASNGSTNGTAASPASRGAVGDIKQLWAANVGDPKRLKRYSFTDEGPTVLLMLDLNDHLEIGAEASNLVESLQQFRVTCDDHSVDVRLRVRRDGLVQEFNLLLSPLAQEIVPEDTVPKLKGRDGKRRLEVKLFKRDKSRAWYGDLVKTGAPPARPSTAKRATPQKGSQLNPLTSDELAKLPKPSSSGNENLPSFWRGPAVEAATSEPDALDEIKVQERDVEPPTADPCTSPAGLESMD